MMLLVFLLCQVQQMLQACLVQLHLTFIRVGCGMELFPPVADMCLTPSLACPSYHQQQGQEAVNG